MPDLEQRVTALEQDVSALKARVGANEEDMANIPELIRTEFRLANSQIARLSRDVMDLQRGFGDLTRKVDAMPRVIAELVTELLGRRGGEA